MRFTKMHGLGNDYVFVNGFEETVADPEQRAPALSDRHFGIGADGLILLLPPEPGVAADIRMRMFNADGSEAEMCGNGVRCLCKLAHDRGVSRARPMRVQTSRGVLSLDYETGPGGRVESVTVDMGEPILAPEAIPVRHTGPGDGDGTLVDAACAALIDWPGGLEADWVAASGFEARMTCLSMGNPHVVFFCDDVDAVPLARLGPVVEHAPIFPRRINVHVVRVHGRDELTMRTWERGSGLTLACGTGASAVCVAGVLTGRTGREVLAHLPGGDLKLRWDEPSRHLFMTGPATEVFTGVLEP